MTKTLTCMLTLAMLSTSTALFANGKPWGSVHVEYLPDLFKSKTESPLLLRVRVGTKIWIPGAEQGANYKVKATITGKSVVAGPTELFKSVGPRTGPGTLLTFVAMTHGESTISVDNGSQTRKCKVTVGISDEHPQRPKPGREHTVYMLPDPQSVKADKEGKKVVKVDVVSGERIRIPIRGVISAGIMPDSSATGGLYYRPTALVERVNADGVVLRAGGHSLDYELEADAPDGGSGECIVDMNYAGRSSETVTYMVTILPN